jgi:hypothetical protein
MDAVSPLSADLVPVALFAPRSRPPPARPRRRATRAGPPLGGPVRSTLEGTFSTPLCLNNVNDPLKELVALQTVQRERTNHIFQLPVFCLPEPARL